MGARLPWNSEGFQWSNNNNNNSNIANFSSNGEEEDILVSSVQSVIRPVNVNGAEPNGADKYSSGNEEDAAYNNNNNTHQMSSDEHEPNEIEEDDEEIDGSSCYLCTQCGKGFASERELESHILTVHEMEDETVMDDTLAEDATIVGDEAEAEARPSSFHHQHQYACKLCPRTFSVSSALNVHYTHTHKDKPQYDCELCGLAFTVKRELATHKRMHEGQPTHKCRQCGKEFGTKQLLRKHELWHTGERTHVCPQCGKAFFQKGHLTQHLMIHAGGRPHVCILCQKTFIFKFDLNRHMKIHAERIIVAATGSSSDVNNINNNSPPGDANFINNNGNNLLTNNANKSQDNFNHLSSADIGALMLASNNSPLTPMFRRRNNNVNGRSMRTSSSLHQPTSPKSEELSEHYVTSPTTYDKEPTSQGNNVLSSMMMVNHNGRDHGCGYDDRNEVSPANSVSSNSAVSSVCCDQCTLYKSDLETARRRMEDLKMLLEQRNQEIEALKSKVHHVSEVTSHLLETCSDFDKLWMLHSKKVYSQIQNVLNALE